MLVVPCTAQEAAWILPYTATPNYWELVALTGIGQPNSKTELFAGPQIRAFAVVPLSVGPGERLALIAEMTLLVGEDLWPVGADIGDMTELRFVGADSTGVSVEIHEAKSPLTRKACGDCTKSQLQRFAHRPDWRYQVFARCSAFVTWSEWRPLRFPLKGSYVVNANGKTLPLSFAMTGGRLAVSVSK